MNQGLKAENSSNFAEINTRRTFCIISHPDAGKTTVTEKFLLFSGEIQSAGTIKSRKSGKFATSDWMEIEKQRGISVTASVLKFNYDNFEVNLLDTPGHQDFIEDTYRAITAVDSALMLVDGAKGVESQTLKLFDVCRQQQIPVMAFINKLDRECLPPLDLLQEMEDILKMEAVPITWPIGQGKDLKGLYQRLRKEVILFSNEDDAELSKYEVLPLSEKAKLAAALGDHHYKQLLQDIELLDIAGRPFNEQDYLSAKQMPVYFGSAMNNFGIEELLHGYLQLSPAPSIKSSLNRKVEAMEPEFSGFVFKIQANMDKRHRDRVVFIRVCSGKFNKGMKLYHCRLKREIKMANPIFFNASKREQLELAFAGDIIGLVDTNLFRVGDSLSQGEELEFQGIARFASEHFARIKNNNSLKSKQLVKGLQLLNEEGTAQFFYSNYGNEQVVGVVGRLQLEVIKFRLTHEFNVDCDIVTLPYSIAYWYSCSDKVQLAEFVSEYQPQVFVDQQKLAVFLAKSAWEHEYIAKKYDKIKFFTNSDLVAQG